MTAGPVDPNEGYSMEDAFAEAEAQRHDDKKKGGAHKSLLKKQIRAALSPENLVYFAIGVFDLIREHRRKR